MAEVHTPPATNAVSAGESEEGHAAPGHAEMTGATEEHGGGHVEPTALGFDASGWVAWAMIAVLLLMILKRVPAAIGKALDKKIAGIRQQLDEATQLRAEAEALRAEYEAKAAQADAEAEGRGRQAASDASALVERRGRMAEDKIAAAERSALDQVRAKAARAAALAAESLIREKLDAGADKALVDRTIEGLGRAN